MKPYKLNLKRIIDNATAMEGKKVSISRAQMAEARRCIFAAVFLEFRRLKSRYSIGAFQELLMIACGEELASFEASALDAKRAKRKHK